VKNLSESIPCVSFTSLVDVIGQQFLKEGINNVNIYIYIILCKVYQFNLILKRLFFTIRII
jgi:hypothetical protein